MQQCAYDFLPLLAISNSLENSKVLEQTLGTHIWVDAKFLRQIAQSLAHLLFLIQELDVAEPDCSRVGQLKCCDRSHKCGLACSVWTEQSEHSLRNRECDSVKRMNAVGVCLRENSLF